MLSNPENVPLLFHSSAKKDRTEFAVTPFLLSLGVERKTVFGDYLLLARFMKKKYRNTVETDKRFALVYTVHRYLEAAFEVSDMESFLWNRLGVDVEFRRKFYTEAV